MNTVLEKKHDDNEVLETYSLRPFVATVVTEVYRGKQFSEIRPYLSSNIVRLIQGEASFDSEILNETEISAALDLDQSLVKGEESVIKIAVSRILEVLPVELRTQELISNLVEVALDKLSTSTSRTVFSTNEA